MKRIFSILLFFLPIAGQSQSTSVQWDVKAIKKSDQDFDLLIRGTIKQNWNVYSEKDEASDLDGIKLAWLNDNIFKNGPAEIKIDPVVYDDPIFQKKLRVYRSHLFLVQPIKVQGSVPSEFNLSIQAFASSKDEFTPIEVSMPVKLTGGIAAKSVKLPGIDVAKPVAACGDRQDGNKGLIAIFIIGFGGGLLALLTPCIFPMIPVTVSFFTGKATTRRQGIRNGFTYGFFILLIYTIASLPFHLVGSIKPEIFNSISTNAWVNVFFFIVFVAFALSFFGIFEIKLPSSLSNAAGNRSGIFFMALTLTIVSFSCTGIILGTLLVNALSANGNAWQLTSGMAGFGFALALPFGLFAMFPQWMQRLPRSGGWLDRVKKTLAFVELALAIKFLSNADLVEHWGILKRETFLFLWLTIAIMLALYLFGFFDKKNGRNLPIGSVAKSQKPYARFTVAAIVLLFAVYVGKGLTPAGSAHMQLLSGLAPPLGYSFYDTENIESKVLLHAIVNDYDKAVELSKKLNKPLLIDFTGWACVNCRKMEELVWTRPSIQTLINEKYVLVSLYVDDRKEMPDGTTVGEKWASFQAQNFGQVTQPLYVVLSPDQKLMNYPIGYTPDEKKYRQWLQCGLDAFHDTYNNQSNNEHE